MKDIKTLTIERIQELEETVQQLAEVRNELELAERELQQCQQILVTLKTPQVNPVKEAATDPVDDDLKEKIAAYKRLRGQTNA